MLWKRNTYVDSFCAAHVGCSAPSSERCSLRKRRAIDTRHASKSRRATGRMTTALSGGGDDEYDNQVGETESQRHTSRPAVRTLPTLREPSAAAAVDLASHTRTALIRPSKSREFLAASAGHGSSR